ncbi:hypothetical protein A5692_23445 [Mycobacterium sp. E342]|nr:hypothetical protein A5692_23445 [Mycobacterium sp. E342]
MGGAQLVEDAGAKDIGRTSQAACDDMGGQLFGNSRVIHMLWKGFLSVGVAPVARPWCRRLLAWAA